MTSGEHVRPVVIQALLTSLPDTLVQLLRHRSDIIDVLSVLHEKTLSERGYDATGRLMFRLMIALIGTHPVESFTANPDEWRSFSFGNEHWGRQYRFEDVVVNWHSTYASSVQCVRILITDGQRHRRMKWPWH